MTRQKAELAVKEMVAEVNEFVRFLQFKKIIFDPISRYNVLDTLRLNGDPDRVDWSYNSGKMSLHLATSSVVCPAQTQMLSCSLDIEVCGSAHIPKTGSDLGWELIKTAMDFEFAAESSTAGSGWSQFWHFDTHPILSSGNPPDEPHPRFHLHFGGKQMALRRKSSAGFFGKTLEMHGPRLVQPPLDLILALDFIVANANGSLWKNKLCNAKEYSRAVFKSQQRFWNPYKKVLLDFYDCDRKEQQRHTARLLWPSLQVREA